MPSLQKTEIIVLEVLNESLEARKSDHSLCVKTYEKLRPDLMAYDFKDIFINYEKYDLPSFKSIERCRRKLTEKGLYNPDENIKSSRDRMIDVYVQYARENERIRGV